MCTISQVFGTPRGFCSATPNDKLARLGNRAGTRAVSRDFREPTLSKRSAGLNAGLLMLAGCSHVQTNAAVKHEVKFDEVVIVGDLELEKLNDEELFAAGTSFYAAEDYVQ